MSANDQEARNFQAKLEYVRQVAESERFRQSAFQEYGMQTLKWSFLMNAGLAGLVLAYVGARAGQSGAAIKDFAATIFALWPFAIGCALVGLAGAAAHFNFMYASQLLPSPEALFTHLVTPDQPNGRYLSTPYQTRLLTPLTIGSIKRLGPLATLPLLVLFCRWHLFCAAYGW